MSSNGTVLRPRSNVALAPLIRPGVEGGGRGGVGRGVVGGGGGRGMVGGE